MILYVNGDSHSCGHDAGGINFSYGRHLATKLNATLVCDAVPGGSNAKVLRTTKEYLKNNTPDLIVIGWTTWEREEWLHDGQYYDVNSSGHTHLPDELKLRFKEWVADEANHRFEQEQSAHNDIYNLHLELTQQDIPHLFFNTYLYFFQLVCYNIPQFNWGNSYISPYANEFTYYRWLTMQGFKEVNPGSYHLGADAHVAWAEFLYPYLTNILKESIMNK